MPKPRIPTSGLDVYFSKQPSASGDLHALHQEDLPPIDIAEKVFFALLLSSQTSQEVSECLTQYFAKAK